MSHSEADQSSLGKDRTSTTPNSTYTSDVSTTPSLTLPGRDNERQPGSSLTDSDPLSVAEASQVATPNYSKRPYVSHSNSHLCNFVSLLSDLR